MRAIAPERMKVWLEKLRPLGVALDAGQCEKMIRLDSMVVKWNRSARLVGFRSDEERFDRYFGEALHASLWLPDEGRVVDVGTGGGSPALPMAIYRPGLEWILLEPNQRKALFLEEVSTTLGLASLKVERSRLMGFRPEVPVQVVTTRGLALSRDSMDAMSQWLDPQGRFFIFSGQKAAERIVDFNQEGWKIKLQQRLAPRCQALLVLLARA